MTLMTKNLFELCSEPHDSNKRKIIEIFYSNKSDNKTIQFVIHCHCDGENQIFNADMDWVSLLSFPELNNILIFMQYHCI